MTWLLRHIARLLLWLRGVDRVFVGTPHARVHLYDVSGRGPGHPLVLVHGLGAEASHWAPLLPWLRGRHRRIVIPDLPGFGFSSDPEDASSESVYRATVAALARVIDEPFVLVGNSLGGAFAVRYAADHPGRVLGLYLVSPAGAVLSEEEWGDAKRMFAMASPAEAWVFLGRLFARRRWFHRVLAGAVARDFQRPWIRRFIGGLRDVERDLVSVARALAIPRRVLWGGQERLLPASSLAQWKSAGIEVVEPADLGHCPQLEAPRRVARMIREFAAGC